MFALVSKSVFCIQAANGNGIFGSTNADDEWLNSHWEDDQYVKSL